MNRSTRNACLAALTLLGLSACSILSPEKDPTRYAVLASVDDFSGAAVGAAGQADASAPSASNVRYGLGPIAMPDYLLRTEIVTRHDGTRLVPSATERWSEPFDRGVERVLAIDLERALGAGRIVHHPWYATDRPDVQIEVAFSRCEREDKGRVVVAAQWTVRQFPESGPVLERQSRIERNVTGSDGASTALELSQALAELASEIAQAVPKPSQGGPAQAPAGTQPK
jgi:uncharacterized lipoprotein YmbA